VTKKLSVFVRFRAASSDIGRGRIDGIFYDHDLDHGDHH
jgi:hypothetical protein